VVRGRRALGSWALLGDFHYVMLGAEGFWEKKEGGERRDITKKGVPQVR